MSVYSVKGKGVRYDFTMKGTRYTSNWFETKREALQEEAKRKEEIRNPQPILVGPIDMDFLALLNEKLDHVKAYNSESHFRDYRYNARRWAKRWGNLNCREITRAMVEGFILERSRISACTANQDLRYLRAAFNHGKKKGLIEVNPTQGIEFFPTEKKIKYVPSQHDIDIVIQMADPDAQDYLWTVRETLARISEVNRLLWDDVNLEGKYVVLYTRKKKGGHMTARKVPMTEKLYEVLSRRFSMRDESKPWVFWHTYKSRKCGQMVSGPYLDRKFIMWRLCVKAGVKYFRFHALRHAGASLMDNNNVPIGAIQKILGHENRPTTEIYLHSFDNTERDAMSVYEMARQKSHIDSHIKKEKGVSYVS